MHGPAGLVAISITLTAMRSKILHASLFLWQPQDGNLCAQRITRGVERRIIWPKVKLRRSAAPIIMIEGQGASTAT